MPHRFTSLYFTLLHFTLHFTSLHFTSLHFTSLHFISLQLNCQVKKPKVIGSTSVAVTPSAKVNDGDRYKADLAKEKKKLKEIKNKSKKERNQDMCEVLGRGC